MPSYKEFRTQTRRRKAKQAAFRILMVIVIAALLFTACYIGIRVWLDKNDLTDNSTPITSVPQVVVPDKLPEVDKVLGVQTWDTIFPVEKTINNMGIVPNSKLLALPQNGKVNLDYFRSAMFIGDSLTQGFGIYPDALRDVSMVCAYKGIGPKSIVTNAVAKNIHDKKVPPLDEIFSYPVENIKSVYLLFGTNVLENQGDDAIMKYYQDMINILKPHFLDNTEFYIQGIPPVTQDTETKRPKFNKEHIYLLNNAIALMAQNNGMHYIDTHEALADDNGYLPLEIAGSDGIHMSTGKGYIPWVDYLASHTAYTPNNIPFYVDLPKAC
ncbi:MAG: GDSL-type esterase/lipase family protein [Oscillospiraceae bacterium]